MTARPHSRFRASIAGVGLCVLIGCGPGERSGPKGAPVARVEPANSGSQEADTGQRTNSNPVAPPRPSVAGAKTRATSHTVTAPGASGTVVLEVSPEVTDEIEVRDPYLTKDFLELRFRLALHRDVNFANSNWHYTAFNTADQKVCDGIVHTQHAIKAGESIPASTVFISPAKKSITKVVIHR